ncbi:RsmE family RNA methyltransferase [Gracilimonas halophila]|uniref:Ribosomal RNA small subunit methyltransferase E n=1 Tax=Gracilimonas halophila TaxID=1834464 RepID=A0ABW5JM63_9BACT
MDNVFYTHPGNIKGGRLELVDQEARHAAKVLRFNIGDKLFASDGKGKLYTTQVTSITKSSVIADIQDSETEPEPEIKKVLGFGAIKKRDRLEFAVEKAVELDAWEICVFNGDHSERSKINQDRLQSIALSAFKQSKRRWLPEIIYKNSLREVMDHYTGYHPIMAHVESEVNKSSKLTTQNNLMLVGPEGGFSDREVAFAKEKGAKFISLGKNRLRAETAVTATLSQYLFTEYK